MRAAKAAPRFGRFRIDRSARPTSRPFVSRKWRRLRGRWARTRRGYSQRALAAEIGISNRMVAYYEAQTEHPPAHLLATIADALGLTADQLLGRERLKKRKAPTNERLLRQLRQVEKLPPRARQSVLEHIEGLVAKYGSER